MSRRRRKMPPESPAANVAVKNEKPAKLKEILLYNCNQCEYTNKKQYLVVRHQKRHTDKRDYKCTVSSAAFKTLDNLKAHVKLHSSGKLYQCKQCSDSFRSSGQVSRHVQYKHTLEKPHKCTECDYACVEITKLRRHMTTHSGERPYQCPHCTYASSDRFKLKRHLRSHSGEKPYQCEICDKSFTQSNSLKSHLRVIHQKVQPYLCPICKSPHPTQTNLNRHMQKIHENSLFQCRLCGLVCTNKYSLRVHRMMHDGDVFQCDSCSYSSKSKSQLVIHMRVHADEKPLRTDSLFQRQLRLRRHIQYNPDYKPKRKSKRNQCDECGVTYALRGNLIRHLKLHEVTKCTITCKVELLDEDDVDSEDREDDQPLSVLRAALLGCIKEEPDI